jgi:Tfp pilus assembly protein PilO
VRKSLLAFLAALLLAIGWWFFFISPRNADIADANDELDAVRAQEQTLRVQIAQLQEIQADELLYLDAITQLEALIPQRPLLDQFIEEIDTLAAASGIELRSLAPSIPVPAEESQLRLINVSAQIEGEFFDVLGFLFGLNDMERLVRVDGVALTSTVDDEGATILNVTLEMRLFTLADLIPTPEDVAAPGFPDEGAPPAEVPDDGGDGEEGTEAAGESDPPSTGPGGG